MSITAKPQSVNQSIQIKQPSTCNYCTDQNPTSESELSYHLNTKHKDKIPPEWLYCLNCSWSYSSKENLNIHGNFCKIKTNSTKNVGQPNIGIQCQFCPTVFGKTTFNMYYKHVRKNHQKQVECEWQKCEICLLAYPTEFILKTHLR